MPAAPQHPQCLSLILCDQVFRDERTKKAIIVGTFNEIRVENLPAKHPSMSVFFTLTEGQGAFDLHVVIEHAASGVEVVRYGGPMTLEDPLGVSDVHLELRDVAFRASGRHWLMLVAGEHDIICQRPFFVTAEGSDSHGRASDADQEK